MRSFASVNSNLSLLIWLLLNKEQMLLFWHHKARAVDVPNEESEKNTLKSEDESSSSEIKHEIPKLDSLASMTKSQDIEKVFGSLIGYQVTSQLDQKLIQGVMKDPSKNKRKLHKPKIILKKRENSINHSTNNIMLTCNDFSQIPVASRNYDQGPQASRQYHQQV